MATERDYQGLYDRIAALRDQVTSRLASDLITNPQLADALNKQIDDMLQSVVDADAKAAAAAGQGARRTRRHRSAGRQGLRPDPHSAGCHSLRRDHPLRAHHRRRRPLLPLSAREDRRLPRRPEAAGTVPRRHRAPVRRSRRLRALSVRPPRGAALHPARPTGRLSPDLQLRRHARACRRRGRTPTSTSCSPISSTRSRCFGATSAFRTSFASAPTIRASARSPSSAAPGSTCATT